MVGSFPSVVAAEGACNPAAGGGGGGAGAGEERSLAAGVVAEEGGSREVADVAVEVDNHAGGWKGLGVAVDAGVGGRAGRPGIAAALFLKTGRTN